MIVPELVPSEKSSVRLNRLCNTSYGLHKNICTTSNTVLVFHIEDRALGKSFVSHVLYE